jgi:hypothetical protein
VCSVDGCSGPSTFSFISSAYRCIPSAMPETLERKSGLSLMYRRRKLEYGSKTSNRKLSQILVQFEMLSNLLAAVFQSCPVNGSNFDVGRA